MDEVLRDSIAEMSLVITKASYDKSEPDPNKKRRITMTNSDVSPDLYKEEMSLELFSEFTRHIENNDPIPAPFKDVLCEDAWCGGMPYLSIAHYHAGREAKNVPGMPESVYIDGKQLKSKAYLYDNPMGRKLFDALCADEEARKSKVADHDPVRVSIGFLDLEHTHEVNGKSVTFTRTELGQKCALCADKVGGKIYKKGYLIHLAATRKPVNPRTEMGLEEKSMDIITKQDDAASIVGEDLAKELEQKSLALTDESIVIKSEESPVSDEIRTYLDTVKSEILDEVKKSLSELQAKPVVEELKMEQEIKSEKVEEVVAPVVSPLDEKFNQLKSAIATAKSAAELQAAFNELGQEVEKSYVAPPPSAGDIAAIVKSAVDEAVTPLKVQIAQLSAAKGEVVARSNEHPVSRALNLKQADLVQKSNARPMTQIQRIARQSTGASVD